MAASARSESVTAILETCLPEWFKSVLDHRLDGPVGDRRDAERSLAPVGLRDVNPSCRKWLPHLVVSESVHQLPPRLWRLEDHLVHAWSVLPSVGLRHLTYRHDAVLVRAKHDPLESTNLPEVAFFRSSEDFLTEL